MKYIKSFLESNSNDSPDIHFNTSVSHIDDDTIYFDNGIKLSYYHDQDCCEGHWLDFTHIELSDFDGLIFDLSDDNFFERIPDYGIALKPLNGYPVRIPEYDNREVSILTIDLFDCLNK